MRLGTEMNYAQANKAIAQAETEEELLKIFRDYSRNMETQLERRAELMEELEDKQKRISSLRADLVACARLAHWLPTVKDKVAIKIFDLNHRT